MIHKAMVYTILAYSLACPRGLCSKVLLLVILKRVATITLGGVLPARQTTLMSKEELHHAIDGCCRVLKGNQFDVRSMQIECDTSQS